MVRSKRSNGKTPTAIQNTRSSVIGAAQRALIQAIFLNGEACADDIRAVVEIPDGIHPSVIGSAVQGLAREGLIVAVKTQTAARPVAHSHLFRVWRLADQDRATAWLASRKTETKTDVGPAGDVQK